MKLKKLVIAVMFVIISVIVSSHYVSKMTTNYKNLIEASQLSKK